MTRTTRYYRQRPSFKEIILVDTSRSKYQTPSTPSLERRLLSETNYLWYAFLNSPRHSYSIVLIFSYIIVEYSKLSHSMERDIFQRVQLGMPLTAAEKLQAIASPWAEWISMLDLQFVNNDNGITNGMNVDMKRGRNFQSLAQMVYCCDGIPEQLIPSAQKMEAWVSREELPDEGFKKAISDVLSEYWHLAHTESLDHAFTKIKQRVAPIEFVFIGARIVLAPSYDTSSS